MSFYVHKKRRQQQQRKKESVESVESPGLQRDTDPIVSNYITARSCVKLKNVNELISHDRKSQFDSNSEMVTSFPNPGFKVTTL